MSTNFPGNLDVLQNPTGTDDVSVVGHASQHANKNDAIEALEAKVGVDSSAVTSSHDYKLANPLTEATGYIKGDIKVGTGADTSAALSVGTDDYFLTADSNEASGVKWAAGPLAQFKKDYVAGESLVVGDAVYRTTGTGTGSNTHSIDLELTSTQYLSIIDGSQTGLEPAGDFTLECWFRPETLGIRQDFISKLDTSVGGFTFGLNPSDELELLFFNGASQSKFSQTTATISSTGTWYHVAVTVDVSAPSVIFYIDGAVVADTVDNSAATSMAGTGSDFQIGKRADEANFYVDGMIDEVRFWDDIRTAEEIGLSKNSKLTGSESNLQGYWELDNDLLDTTSNNNDLTNNGSAVFSTTIPTLGGEIRKVDAVGTYASFIGFSNEIIAEDATGAVVIVGEMTGLSGLSIGSAYYISDTPGSISTTPGTNTKKVGVALTATTLLITNG